MVLIRRIRGGERLSEKSAEFGIQNLIISDDPPFEGSEMPDLNS
jgi:hypothetical protein